MKAILSIKVLDHAGVLSKVAGLFSRRGFNIDSLAVGVTEIPGISRMTIVVDGDEALIEQITKQLNKLIDVIKVSMIDHDPVARELALIRINAPQKNRQEILQTLEVFRARIVGMDQSSVTAEVTGEGQKINALLDLMVAYGIQEMVRTGTVAIDRRQPKNQEGV